MAWFLNRNIFVAMRHCIITTPNKLCEEAKEGILEDQQNKSRHGKSDNKLEGKAAKKRIQGANTFTRMAYTEVLAGDLGKCRDTAHRACSCSKDTVFTSIHGNSWIAQSQPRVETNKTLVPEEK